MKKTMVYRAVAMISIMLAFSVCAQAQFGNLGKKLKNTVKQKVEEKSTKESTKSSDKTYTVSDENNNQAKNETPVTTNNLVKKVESNAGVSSDNNAPAAKQNQESGPSAEAKAADPMANDNTVPPGFSKTNAQIRAAYEKLDPKIFVYQPYYKYLNLNNKQGDSEEAISAYFPDLSQDLYKYPAGIILKSIYRRFDANGVYVNRQKIPLTGYYKKVNANGEMCYMPAFDVFANCYSSIALADPDCEKGVEMAVNAILLDIFSKEMQIEAELPLEDSYSGIIDSKKDMYLYDGTLNKLIKRMDDRFSLIYRLYEGNDALQARVMEFIKAVKATIVKQEEAGEYVDAAFSMRQLRVALDLLNEGTDLTRHRGFIDAHSDIWDNAAILASPTRQMPKTVAAPGGNIPAKATAAAKAQWGDKLVKVIYFENTWRAIKSTRYPYNLVAYNMLAGAVLKLGNDYLVQEFTLAKGATGDNIIVGPLGSKVKVLYK